MGKTAEEGDTNLNQNKVFLSPLLFGESEIPRSASREQAALTALT